ncbi:MAG: 50S ribosomal protein L24 [Candidatus Moranbacteria bacterium GW2011_GWC2_37_73]|nr:MAG: 50S ribosomal protein L24 [Parcubacteria group bacterium GW2011_GWC1_36_108]KKQ00475.1 MAG: 50S ribosomal protein L24 [Candidatus Moranbacteria bacterium GW2011_GWD1_36_198]KKQ01707.1 MAG: 50S ribosomal protein L24 [Candidatus Moranbacteria bacterium GW2011_GWD2_36_198]KKQ39608.1 MAG: 50S ribosomal protein L24 [Candidatus Moranbacteria bacterium GW2011_GWC2_37_73]MDD5463887.1 50S ribosomal protein L24 [Candidatus Moranbacteria bacterium]
MRIKKGDLVKKIAGKDKGKQGKVVRTVPSEGKIVVEKLNIVTKHQKSRREGQRGQRVEIAAPFDASNAMIICPGCGKTTRVSYQTTNGKKVRVCKKCGKEI